MYHKGMPAEVGGKGHRHRCVPVYEQLHEHSIKGRDGHAVLGPSGVGAGLLVVQDELTAVSLVLWSSPAPPAQVVTGAWLQGLLPLAPTCPAYYMRTYPTTHVSPVLLSVR